MTARAQLLYVTNADGVSVTITGLYSTLYWMLLIIPATINGRTVTAIGETAFADDYGLTGITIPNTVTTIEEDAFSNSGLTNATIPYGVTNIGDGAFEDCYNLTNATIPESVTYIGQGAFSDGLVSVTIPNSVIFMGDGAFSDCGDLTNVVISYGISSLQTEVFAACYSLPSVIIPSSVTNITDNAFEGCSLLTNAFFEGNAPFVDTTAFHNFRQPPGPEEGILPTMSLRHFLSSRHYGVGVNLNPILFVPVTNIYDSGGVVESSQDSGNGNKIRHTERAAFGFDVTAKTNLPVAIEACDDLSQSNWVVLKRLTLTNGLFHFSEPFQSNSPARFYRIGFPWSASSCPSRASCNHPPSDK